MKHLILLVILTLLTGCAGMEPGTHPNFWTQCIKLQAWGVSAVTTWGPINLGWAQYERNVDCKTNQPVVKPTLTLPSIGPTLLNIP